MCCRPPEVAAFWVHELGEQGVDVVLGRQQGGSTGGVGVLAACALAKAQGHAGRAVPNHVSPAGRESSQGGEHGGSKVCLSLSCKLALQRSLSSQQIIQDAGLLLKYN